MSATHQLNLGSIGSSLLIGIRELHLKLQQQNNVRVAKAENADNNSIDVASWAALQDTAEELVRSLRLWRVLDLEERLGRPWETEPFYIGYGFDLLVLQARYWQYLMRPKSLEQMERERFFNSQMENREDTVSGQDRRPVPGEFDGPVFDPNFWDNFRTQTLWAPREDRHGIDPGNISPRTVPPPPIPPTSPRRPQGQILPKSSKKD
ncbi:hypothetical protein B0T17DRAFT_538556 [Bombardia bombarda]|uniref:Uncharacterized protein n=1 Tax=Bombardia bombarda TaxID=252184 RepID=A0AA39WHP0_9PEZI|nr:hypothetical protein B0T17DRAFT_538556 [Bombardia bombarda]